VNTVNRKASAGFSLVEIMVGLTIGLITVLVITQVMGVAEARKRTSTSGADSILNAALGLYTIERDAKNAGYGMTTVNATVGCPVKAQNNGVDLDFQMVPAVITDGTNGSADTIRFLASNKNGVTMPTKISVDHSKTAANFFVESDLGIEEGDLILAVPAVLDTSITPTNWCTVAQVTGMGGNNNNNGGGQGQNQVLHNSGQSPLNQAGGQSIMPNDGYGVGDYLFNLGDLSDHTYRIEDNFLVLRDFNLKTNVTNNLFLYPHIVQMQAVYGKDTTGDSIVDAWNATAPTTAAQWQQVRALRIALVARSQTAETSTVTLDGTVAASTCDSTNPNPAAICWRPDPGGNGVVINVNIGNANPNWQKYRYRVMETTIPLRNVIWQQ
jgi:type IV pilus assembly protein PilW